MVRRIFKNKMQRVYGFQVHQKLREAFGDLYPWERRTNEETLRELVSTNGKIDEKAMAQSFLKWMEETPELQLQEPKNPAFPKIPAVQMLGELVCLTFSDVHI